MAANAEEAGAVCWSDWDEREERNGDDAARATGPSEKMIKIKNDAHRLSKYQCPWARRLHTMKGRGTALSGPLSALCG